MCLSKSLGHFRGPYGLPHCFPLIMVPKPHLIQKMCFKTPMCTHRPYELHPPCIHHTAGTLSFVYKHKT